MLRHKLEQRHLPRCRMSPDQRRGTRLGLIDDRPPRPVTRRDDARPTTVTPTGAADELSATFEANIADRSPFLSG